MKFNTNDGASALEESATPPSITICMVEVHIGMILSVLLRIVVPFVIVRPGHHDKKTLSFQPSFFNHTFDVETNLLKASTIEFRSTMKIYSIFQ